MPVGEFERFIPSDFTCIRVGNDLKEAQVGERGITPFPSRAAISNTDGKYIGQFEFPNIWNSCAQDDLLVEDTKDFWSPLIG